MLTMAQASPGGSIHCAESMNKTSSMCTQFSAGAQGPMARKSTGQVTTVPGSSGPTWSHQRLHSTTPFTLSMELGGMLGDETNSRQPGGKISLTYTVLISSLLVFSTDSRKVTVSPMLAWPLPGVCKALETSTEY